MTATFSSNARILDFLTTLSIDHGLEFDNANTVPEVNIIMDPDGWGLVVYVPGHETFSSQEQPTLEHCTQEALEWFGQKMPMLRGNGQKCTEYHPYRG